MVNYAVSDMITRLRNAIRVKKTKVEIISTLLTQSISDILKREGYIEESYQHINEKGQKELHLVLKYEGKKMLPVLTNLKCLSKPGVRLYSNTKEIPQVLGGLGITIISTSKGILTDYEARKLGVGGELLCMIW
jgi:small subunit ribosomal protein S8